MTKVGKSKGALQAVQFSMIGVLNAIIDLGALNLLLMSRPTKDVLTLFLYNTFAYVLAVLNSYFWNSRLTFRRQAYFGVRETLLFTAQATVSLFISNGVFLLFTHLLGYLNIPLWIVHNGAKGLSMAISSMSSFFFMKYFVFRSR